MNNLPSLKEFGIQLDLLKKLLKDCKDDHASNIAQSIFESYVFARDEVLRTEDKLITTRNTLDELSERYDKVELKLKETLSAYSSDFQFFSKLCRAFDSINTLRSISELSDILVDISKGLGINKLTVVLERDLCSGIDCSEIPTFYMQGCMRYIDATLSPGPNRVFIGPINKMMRPDIFFGDPEMSPDSDGSCFAFGLMNKYKPGELIGLLSIYDPSENRYHPEMATDFLEHFCNSMASTLIDVINHQQADILRHDVESITRHDLKTPLNAVINLPYVLLDDETDPSRIEMIEAIQDSGYKLLGLINRSYDIYRMESGTYSLNPEGVDLIPLIDHIKRDLSLLAESKDVVLKVFIDERESMKNDQFIVRGEELLLFSMLANLIKNALEATPDIQPVSIYLANFEKSTISIHNSGAVPEIVRKSFFDKYSTEGKADGTGLGTYSARLIVRAHDGEISMESSASKGTTVTVKLPLSKEQ
ncbi:sensor histidine kinase [Maridesulfovibrio zosterae]|uniref:sensor histidine kinase n=1 Tax=Maridesulfovibrio zosterae TaxID=82171 RepID=UPI0003FE6E5B|nr:HAMP domain-containing sensor histidine kinase [Maridesulfovibrio zosterae]